MSRPHPVLAVPTSNPGNSETGQAFEVPEETYETIETMLPSGKGQFLELWAKPGCIRSGWTHIAEKQEAQGVGIDIL